MCVRCRGAACGLLPHGCSGRRVACLAGPGRCVCRWAAARPRDRHTRACGSEWSISRPALAPPPPTGTAAWPSGALHTGGAGSLTCGSARRLVVRPGPATAHRHRGQAPRFAARPCPPVPPAPTGTAAWPSGPSAALRTGSDGGFAALEAGWRSIYGVSQL